MNLFILRHPSAGERRLNPLLDVRRPLDKDGKRHCLHLAHILNAINVQFDLILSSPLKRCLQTAAFIGTETGYENRIQVTNALAPTATLVDFQRLLRENAHVENLLVIGHNPNLTAFLGTLLVPVASATSAQIRLRKGSLARLSLSRGPATLQWLLDPRMVRALYTTSTKSTRRKPAKK